MKRVLWTHIYFCSTIGEVLENTLNKYIRKTRLECDSYARVKTSHLSLMFLVKIKIEHCIMIKVNLKKKRPSLNYLFEDAESTQRALKYAKDSWRKMQEKTENAVSDFANTILNSNGIDAETRRSAQSILADYAKNGIKGSEVDTEMPFELSNGETISFTPLY